MHVQLKIPIQELIARREWGELRTALRNWEAPDLADLLKELDKTERALLFRALPKLISAEAFSHLPPADRDALLRDLSDAEVRALLAALEPDDRTELLSELPGQVTQRLLNLLGPADLLEVRTLLGYPEESVGRLMTPDYVAVRPDWTIADAVAHVRRRGRDAETIDWVYVVDPRWRLVGAISLRRLILTDPQQTVEQVMEHSWVCASAFDDRERAVELAQRYDLVALPVVDSDGVLLGIVTVDDLLDVAEEEATEDFHKTASVVPLRKGYWESTPWTLYRLRIGWLAALVFVNLISSGVIATFEMTLTAVVALNFFIPLITATGGNTGMQSATIIIRALSTGDVRLGEWGRAVLRELGLGIAIGATLGLLGMGLGILRGGSELGLSIGLVVLLTMLVMLAVTNLIGVTLPFALARLRLDPAIASGPLITSLSDSIALFIYFSIATAILL